MSQPPLSGKRIFFFGKLAGATRREAALLVRQQGGLVSQLLSPKVNLVVVGEAEVLARDFESWSEPLDSETKEAFESGKLDILSESAFWNLLASAEDETERPPLFTAAMLAEAVDVPIASIRLWQRRGLIVPAVYVRNLAYYDFQEVLTAKTLRDLLRSGISPEMLEKRLQSVRRMLPDISRPLAQLSVILEGKDLLLRNGEMLVDQKGQRRIDFDAWEFDTDEYELADDEGRDKPDSMLHCLDAAIAPSGPDVSTLCDMALALEEGGRLNEALAMYRAALAAEGPEAGLCFQVAELLYRLGELQAARERYYMVLELDEDDVEARANLGCVLAELGETNLAVSAFQGALKYHPDYADVHYHLGLLLWRQGRKDEAQSHFREFLKLHPESPWADGIRELTGGI